MGENLLKIQQVCDIVNLTRWSVYRNIKENGFPKPIKQNARIARWDETAVREWHANVYRAKMNAEEKVRANLQTDRQRRMTISFATNDPFDQTKIVSLKQTVPSLTVRCGIYFLIKNDVIVYVGQSSGLLIKRIFSHLTMKDFDSFVCMPCKETQLNFLETYFILKFKPLLNGRTENTIIVSMGRREFAALDVDALFSEWQASSGATE